MRADNGAEMARLEAPDVDCWLTNQANLEAARSSLDGCRYRHGEHTNCFFLAKHNILVQSSARTC